MVIGIILSMALVAGIVWMCVTKNERAINIVGFICIVGMCLGLITIGLVLWFSAGTLGIVMGTMFMILAVMFGTMAIEPLELLGWVRCGKYLNWL